jgi:folylpolyglutamate synthase/dihydropteroate synthase
MPVETLEAALGEAGFETGSAPDVPAAVRAALARAGRGRVLLTGSLFAVGEAMEAFGGAPGEWL